MASGVAVADEVIKAFNDMKVHSCQSDESHRKKAIVFRLSDDLKEIICDDGAHIMQSAVGHTVHDAYCEFVHMLPENECRYALFDAEYETCETKRKDMVFFFWGPDGATTRQRMIYASSKDAIKKKMPGLKFEVQANGKEDLDCKCVAEKISSVITCFEGKRL